MFGKAVKAFDIFGFTVKIDLSWLIILALVIWSLGWAVFPAQAPGYTWRMYLPMALLGAVGLFVSIVLHELSHSLVARRFGMPMGGITLFVFGGIAQMRDQPPNPKTEFFMALAGPVVSILFGAALLGLAAALRLAETWRPVVLVVRWIGVLNLILAGFNLIPGYPLDGGRILRSIVWRFTNSLRRATRVASTVGSGFGMVLAIFGALQILGGAVVGGLWLILIGLFVRGAAKQSYQQVLIRQTLAGEPVSRFMTAEPITVGSDTPVETFVQDYIYAHHHKLFPVVDEGELTGVVGSRDVGELPRQVWGNRTVADIKGELTDENTIAPDADATDALRRMAQGGPSRLVVVRQGRLEGILALKDLLDFLNLKLELESDVEPPRRAPAVGDATAPTKA